MTTNMNNEKKEKEQEEAQIMLPNHTVGFICELMQHVLKKQWITEPITIGYIIDAIGELSEKLEWPVRNHHTTNNHVN